MNIRLTALVAIGLTLAGCSTINNATVSDQN